MLCWIYLYLVQRHNHVKFDWFPKVLHLKISTLIVNSYPFIFINCGLYCLSWFLHLLFLSLPDHLILLINFPSSLFYLSGNGFIDKTEVSCNDKIYLSVIFAGKRYLVSGSYLNFQHMVFLRSFNYRCSYCGYGYFAL